MADISPFVLTSVCPANHFLFNLSFFQQELCVRGVKEAEPEKVNARKEKASLTDSFHSPNLKIKLSISSLSSSCVWHRWMGGA